MKALIVVDVQNDFCYGGSLAVKDGDQVVPFINKISKGYGLVIFTKDDHPPKMEAFASCCDGKEPFETYVNSQGKEDILWPDHCVVGTEGNKLHKDLDFDGLDEYVIFEKGQEIDHHPYSGFAGTVMVWDDHIDLNRFLILRKIEEIDVVGLALDYCVKETALDGSRLGYKTNVLLEGCRGISLDLSSTYKELEENGINLIGDKVNV